MSGCGRKSWKVGDYFVIPLADSTYCIGQVLAIEPDALNSVICAFYSVQVRAVPGTVPASVQEKNLLSVQFVTRDLLDVGVWSVFANGPPINAGKYLKIEELIAKDYMGVKVIGSGNMVKLMNAYYRLAPWDAFYKSDYLDKLLISPKRKPKHVLLSGRHQVR